MDAAPPSYDSVVAGSFDNPTCHQAHTQPPPPQGVPYSHPTPWCQASPSTQQQQATQPYPDQPVEYGGVVVNEKINTPTVITQDEQPAENATNKDGKCDGYNVIGFALIVAIFSAIPVTMIYFGATNLDKCPMEDQIPLFLVVSGSTAILMALLFSGLIVFEGTLQNISLGVLVLTTLALFGMQCWGSYVVFRNWSYWEKYGDILKNNYVFGCDSTTYLLSFSVLVIFWILAPCVYAGSKSSS